MLLRKIYCIFVLLLSVAGQAQAQKAWHGTVRREKGAAVRNATCRLLDKKDSLLSYTLSKADGTYSLPAVPGGAAIEVTAFGLERQRAYLVEGQEWYDFQLAGKVEVLKEAVVRAEPIRRNQDTLYYQAEAFRKAEDQTAEDILKRLPGITVESSGVILYKGEAINHVNIEGLNMMGDNYNLATKNMPAEAVSQIQVMEHNQPIRALEGKEKNTRATLNLKLKKKYLLRPFGTLQLGAGMSPFVWNNRLSAMAFGKKDQFFVTGEMNNAGISLGHALGGMNTYSLSANVPAPFPFYQPTTQRSAPLSRNRLLFNHSHAVTVHYLHAFTKQSVLRSNFAYLREKMEQGDATQTDVYAGDTVHLFQQSQRRALSEVFKGSLNYELNSPVIYLQERLEGDYSWGRHFYDGQTNTGKMTENIRSNPHSLKNTLEVRWRVSNDRLYSFSSLVRFWGSHESLQVDGDPLAVPPHSGKMRHRNFVAEHGVNTDFTLWGNELGLDYRYEVGRNSLSPEPGRWYRTDYYRHTVAADYDFMLGKANVTVNAPLEWLSVRHSWKGERQRKWLFAPSIDVSARINYQYDTSFGLMWNALASPYGNYLPGAMRRSYRLVTQSLDSLPTQRTTMANWKLSYLNTLHLFSWNIYLAWTKSNFQTYQRNLYTPDYTYLTNVWADTRQVSWSANASLKKTWRDAGVELAPSVSYSYNKSWSDYNGRADYVRYHVANASFSLAWNKLSALHVTLGAGGNIMWKAYDDFSPHSNVLKNALWELRADVFPLPKLQFIALFSQTATELTKGHFVSCAFLDIKGSYELFPQFFVELLVSNLFNRCQYEEASYRGSIYEAYRLPLRGRECRLTVKFKF